MDLPRRRFLASIPLVMGSAAAASGRAWGQGVASQPPLDRYPQQEAEVVRELVGAAHRDEAKVREIVGNFPSMVNAAWDWGFGDWETPLGAAAHTGRRSIAEFLLQQGARMDLFAAAMLGHVDIIRASLATDPALASIRGPHGITLMAHARAGGEAADAVVQYLATIPDADVAEMDLPTGDAERRALEGRYWFGDAEGDCFDVIFARQLQIRRPGQGARPLKRVSESDYAPSGTPRVLIRFGAGELTILDGPRTLTATRR